MRPTARLFKPVLQVILLLAVFFLYLGMYLASICVLQMLLITYFKLLFIMFVLSKMLTYSVILKLWNILYETYLGGIDLKFLYH